MTLTMSGSRPAANPLIVDTGSPPIPEAGGWLAGYGGRYGPALRLSQAAPGMPPPPEMLEALAAAARDPATATYGPIAGDLDLTAAYARHVSGLYGTAVSADEIAITTGCNQAFMVALMAVAKAGDAIVLPEPWYFNHEMTARMLGIEVRALPCRAENGFVPTVDDAARLMADGRVRALLLVTPNNPTGAIYAPETIAAFADLSGRHGCWLIIDETYRDFLDGARAKPHRLFDREATRNGMIQLYSFSKSYAIPGYRVGALRAPLALMPEISKILDCLQICAPRVGQRALVWGLEHLAAWRDDNRATILARGTAFRRVLAGGSGWQIRAMGAYFAYVEHPFADRTATEVARALAQQRGVLALPGTYFGTSAQARYLRFAFGNADEAAIMGLNTRLADLQVG
jgi:aspartate/methionine/tyrosine aminotransferase